MRVVEFPFGNGIRAFSTERGAGVASSDPYSGFSACDYTGDTAAHVAACRRELYDYLEADSLHVAMPRQTHSDVVAVVGHDTMPVLDGVDGLVTNVPGVALTINTADCVPVLLADADRRIIGAVHSGWRGTDACIVGRAVERMMELGADAGNIIAWIGPCICGDCYEVGEEVAARFERYPGAVIRGAGKPHLSLPTVIASQLERAGVPSVNIHFSGFCSYSLTDRFFSARRLGVASGRTLSCIMLAE